MPINRTDWLSIDWSYPEQTKLKPNTVFLWCSSKTQFFVANTAFLLWKFVNTAYLSGFHSMFENYTILNCLFLKLNEILNWIFSTKYWMNNFLTEYFRLNFELNHFSARFNVKIQRPLGAAGQNWLQVPLIPLFNSPTND